MEHTVLNGFVNLLGYFKTLTYVLSGHSFVFLPQACKCQRQPCVGEKRRREEAETMNCIPDGFGMVSFKGLLLFVGFFSFILLKTDLSGSFTLAWNSVAQTGFLISTLVPRPLRPRRLDFPCHQYAQRRPSDML